MPTIQRGLHKEQIKAALRMSGSTLTALSKSWGFDRSAISVALTRPWPEVETRIAETIGLPVQEIWPARYFPDGSPRPRAANSNDQPSDTCPARNSELSAAA